MSEKEKKFSVFMMNVLTEGDLSSNGGYHHPTHRGTMFISKDGVTITLTSDEIKDVVKAARGNFNR